MDVVLTVAGVVAALPAMEWLRAAWRRGPGSRRDCQRRAEILSVGVTRARFEELLAMGAATHTATHQQPGCGGFFTSRLFQTEWCSVQVVTDVNDTVHRFAVWSRHRKFRPTYRLGGQWPRRDVTLRETSLEEMGDPTEIRARVGAQTAQYVEEHHYGRPGDYRYYQAGFTESAMELDAVLPSDFSRVLTNYKRPDEELPPEILEFRHRNLLSVYGESLSPMSEDGHSFGPTKVETWAIRDRVTWAVRRADRKFARRFAKEMEVAP